MAVKLEAGKIWLSAPLPFPSQLDFEHLERPVLQVTNGGCGSQHFLRSERHRAFCIQVGPWVLLISSLHLVGGLPKGLLAASVLPGGNHSVEVRVHLYSVSLQICPVQRCLALRAKSFASLTLVTVRSSSLWMSLRRIFSILRSIPRCVTASCFLRLCERPGVASVKKRCRYSRNEEICTNILVFYVI